MITLTSPAKGARLTGLRDYLASGAGTARLTLYAAPQPPLGDPPGGPDLVRIDLDDAIGSVSGDTLTLAVPSLVNVAAGGTISWGRLTGRDGQHAADLTAGLTGSGQAIELNTLTVYAGGLLAITSAILRE